MRKNVRKNTKKNNFIFRFCVAFFTATFLFPIIAPENVTAVANSSFISEAKGECVMEMNSRRVLYEKSGDLRLPMASTTKIITCITVLELCDNLQEEIIIPAEATQIEGSSVYLKAGEKYTVEDLLYGLMLRSGNDCATALALYCSGSIQNFSAKMNETAQKAGALDSRFQNPHGLPAKDHYTTAHDLGLITCYAMQSPIFRKIVSTESYEKRGWKNKNKMLTTYEGGVGVKTGYTKQAGRCLVSAATRNEMTLICVVLNCSTTYERSIKLLDDAFYAYEYALLLDKNTPLQIDDTKKIGYSEKSYYYPLLKEEKDLINIYTKPSLNTKSTEIIGEFEIYLSKRLLFLGNLYKL